MVDPAATAPIPQRFDNDAFFASVAERHGPASISETVFYAGDERPAPEKSLAEVIAETPMRYGLAIFALGWASILFQRSFLQQIVVGAPVFEELAKLGPALVLVTLLRLRSPFVRAPVAWLSGAAFGLFEHAVTYSDEDPLMFTSRVMFHAGSTVLSMVVFTAVEHAPDVRARWTSTAASTLLHWANNFLAIVLGLGSLFLPALDMAGTAWSFLIVGVIYAAVVWALASGGRFDALVGRALSFAVPRLGFGSDERGLQKL